MNKKKIVCISMALILIFTNVLILSANGDENLKEISASDIETSYSIYADGELARWIDFDGMSWYPVAGNKYGDEIYVEATRFYEAINGPYSAVGYLTDTGYIYMETPVGTMTINVYTGTYKYKSKSGKFEHLPIKIKNGYESTRVYYIPLGDFMEVLGRPMVIDNANRTISLYFLTGNTPTPTLTPTQTPTQTPTPTYSGAKEIILKIGKNTMFVDGVEKEVDPGRDTFPELVSNRTLVPIRAIVEAFAGNVSWNEDTKKVHIASDNKTIILKIHSTLAYVNGQEKVMDVGPRLIKSRTMVPLRFVSENLNINVYWDQVNKQITLKR